MYRLLGENHIMIMSMPQPAENLKIRLVSVGSPVVSTPLPAQIEGGINPADLKISYKVNVEINRPESKVNVEVSMVYLLGQETIFSGSVTSVFDVVDLASYINISEGEDKFRIESDFLPMLINTAFSTTRGCLARELAGTALAPYPFPLILMENIQKRTSFQLI